MFSKSCQYALQAVLFLAIQHQKGQKKVSLKEIAASQEIPLHFLSKILQSLVKVNILVSEKGKNGGFYLNHPANELTLHDIVKPIDGLSIFDRCGIGLKACSDKNPCPVHFEFNIVKTKIRQLLTEKTIAELVKDVEEGRSIVGIRN